ncbi:MAG TPA: N-methyl-L-tryptophan oxidase [Burkholderiales bacterium]|nr:N-methyl-L-tryptophan oxidase [Burkholderiales bacterium]
MKTWDVAVVGAGCFGAWTALSLRRKGLSVLLVDKYGPASARASSGGESRIIRMGYGPDELYTRMSLRSLGAWQRLGAEARESIFHATGVLWLARTADRYTADTLATLARVGVPHEGLDARSIRARYPQFVLDDDASGIFEPEGGALMARRAVHALVREAVQAGAEYRSADVVPPGARGRVAAVRTGDGAAIAAGTFVFACGPWLPKMFPDLLGARIFPTRQEVFFFGPPPGDERFAAPQMPAWIDFGAETYGLPDLESRGFKLAPDRHGEPIDPDTDERLASPASVERVRAFLGRRFPALASAPLVETRVCQYENTSNGDFLIDRHPDAENVWFVGGGSGHGFKHGPAVGEYVAERLTGGGTPEPRFGLATKQAVKKRTVF